MERHDYVTDGRGRCGVCGSQYHCGQCGGPSSSYGHLVRDDDGDFHSCHDPARWQRKQALDRFRREQNEQRTLRDLVRKYPDVARNELEGL